MEPKTELQKNAIAQARKQELETFQRALDVQWLNSRMEDGRMGRCLALIQREANMEKDYHERTDHAAIVNTRTAKETALGIEIAKVRREEACELLRRHYLRERDPGLRELTKKLQAAYVCRDQKQQMLHNEYRRLQDKAEENRANKILNNALYNDKEQQDLEERVKKDQSAKYCQELQQQLVNRQRERQCQYEDTLVEKKMLDDVLRTIADEDMRELQQKREQTEKMRNEMVTFKKAREAWKEKQKQMLIVEEKQIEAQQKALSDRDAVIVAARSERLRIKEDINAKISSKIIADETARQQRDDVIKLLQEQEQLEKNYQEEAAGREQAARVKRETKEALTSQMEMRRKLERDQREIEVEFRKETSAKIAAEEQKERETQLKLRSKNKAYSMELLRQAELQRRKRQECQREDEARAKHVWEYDAAWQAEVSKERKKIIGEHAPHLIGYMQAGVIKKEDLPTVREGASRHEHLARLDIEGMAASTRPKRFAKCNAQCRILREY